MLVEVDRNHINLDEAHRLVYEKAQVIGLTMTDLKICEYDKNTITLRPDCEISSVKDTVKSWYWEFKIVLPI